VLDALVHREDRDVSGPGFVLYDDTGQAAWSPYGGRINMPTIDRLAKNGFTYTQWHTVALEFHMWLYHI
jgi:arylsulfatase